MCFTNGFVVMLHAKYDNIFEVDFNVFKGPNRVKNCNAGLVKKPLFYTFLKERKGNSMLYCFLLFSDFLQRGRKNFFVILSYCIKFRNAWIDRVKLFFLGAKCYVLRIIAPVNIECLAHVWILQSINIISRNVRPKGHLFWVWCR